MDRAAVIGLLRRSDLFGGLDDDTLGSVAGSFAGRVFKKGQIIFHQGDLGDSLFVIAEGLVKVMVTSSDGGEMVLTTLSPPDIFGELAVFDGGPRSASAEALENTSTFGITRGRFLELLRQHPKLEDGLLTSTGKVLRRLTEQASDLVFLDLHGRVAKLLINLVESRGTTEDGDLMLDLRLTQADLAGMVGGSRQRVNGILRSFEEHGYLAVEGRMIRFKRPDLLRERASV